MPMNTSPVGSSGVPLSSNTGLSSGHRSSLINWVPVGLFKNACSVSLIASMLLTFGSVDATTGSGGQIHLKKNAMCVPWVRGSYTKLVHVPVMPAGQVAEYVYGT